MKTTATIILSLIINESDSKDKPITEDMPSCSNLIFIDVTTIPELARENWKLTNARYLSVPQPIDTDLATINPTEIDFNEYPSWLVKNQDYISYDKTSDYIECIHTITDPKLKAAIDLVPIHSTLTLGEIKTQITANGGDFYTTKYNKYVSFNNNWQGKIAISLPPFYALGNCYSFSLLRKLASKGLTDDSVFKFKEIDYHENGRKSIVFIIEHDSLTNTYLNFSHIPPIHGYDYGSIYAS